MGEALITRRGGKNVATGTITVYNGSFSNNSKISTPALPFKPVGAVFIWLADESGDSIGGSSCCAIATKEHKQTIHAYSTSSMGTSSSQSYSVAHSDSDITVTFGDNSISINDADYKFPKGETMFYVAWGE